MTKGLFGRLQQELEVRAHPPGLTMADILELPDAERQLVNWLMRAGDVSLVDIAKQFGQDEPFVEGQLNTLIERGFVRETVSQGVTAYQVRMAPRRKRKLPENLWRALDKIIEQKDAG